MKKFDRINSYNKKFSEELSNSIKLILPKLTNAFVNIYGEKHKDYICYTLENIKFVYFISERLLKVADSYEANLSHHQKYIIKYYLNYLKQLDFIGYSVNENDLYKFIYDKFIVKTDMDYDDLFINNLLLYDDPLFTFADLGGIEKVIKLPIYIIDLKTVIHELNHALCIDAVAVNDNEIISPNLFCNIETEEIINDYIADLVLKEFIKLGGIIPKELNRFNIINRYEYNYYIVEYLFHNLSPLIIEALISKRFKLLSFFICENDLYELDNLISDLYINGYDEYKYKKLIKIVDIAFLNILNKEILSTNEYLLNMEKMGLKLRRLK